MRNIGGRAGVADVVALALIELLAELGSSSALCFVASARVVFESFAKLLFVVVCFSSFRVVMLASVVEESSSVSAMVTIVLAFVVVLLGTEKSTFSSCLRLSSALSLSGSSASRGWAAVFVVSERFQEIIMRKPI